MAEFRARRTRHSAVHVILNYIYDTLTRTDPVQPADLIIVMAARMDRKQYGIELYRRGIAPRLLLSVGRFEVSKMRTLGCEGIETLVALRDATPTDKRHFFLEFHERGTRVRRADLLKWNTFGEVLGLREVLNFQNVRTVNVISTGIHLRRVALTFSRTCTENGALVRFCPVPDTLSSVRRDSWWVRPADRGYVMSELFKLAAYTLILALPASMGRFFFKWNR
jgi:hypothetical protein